MEEYAGFLTGELIKQGSFDRYNLAGYSSGGTIALEMARQLGDKVGQVFFIDTPNYKIYPEMLNFSMILKNTFTAVRYYSIKDIFAYMRRYFGEVKQKKNMIAEWRKLIAMIRAYEPDANGMPVFLITSSEITARTDSKLGWQLLIPGDMAAHFDSGHISIMQKKAPEIARIIDSAM